jgi:glycine cleavage system H protein
MALPADLRYTEEHEWARLEDDRVIVGITEYAQAQLGDVVYVELPKVGDRVRRMKPFGVVESVKAASDLFSPLTGTIVAVNARLTDEPELVNTDPYGDGWMVAIETDDAAELATLLSPDDYADLLAP